MSLNNFQMLSVEEYSMAYETSTRAIRVLNDAYKYSLTNDSPQVGQPTEIKVSLRPHQKAILYEMEQREQKLSRGMDMSGARVFSDFSFLGDGVGVGKSLMVLGHVARLKQLPAIPRIPTLDSHSTSRMYSLQELTYETDLTEIGCLIVVPHTLYRQWQTYIKEQSNLKFLGIQTKRTLAQENIATLVRDAELILVSNTLYAGLSSIVYDNHYLWKRVFWDEADTIHIPSTRIRPNTRFTWLISASWPNLLFPNSSLYLRRSELNVLLNDQADPIDPTWKEDLQNHLRESGSANYITLRHYVTSGPFFREYLYSGNGFRGRLVLRCRDEFVKESITLPRITIRNIMCKASIIQQVVAGAIPAEVRTFLHAGDIGAALNHLGVKAEEPMSLVQAVTENRLKELERLRKTYDFKAGMEYSTPQAKEQALKSLKDKIASLEEQVKGLKERIENYKDEMCPICFDEPQNPTLTPCCSRIFCAACILTSLSHSSDARPTTCPLCRTPIQAGGLRNLATQPIPAKNEIIDPNAPPEPLKKTEQIVELIKQIPNGKFLVFSRYDNPFLQLSNEIESMKIKVKQVRGNKDVIASTLKSFQKGDTRVLLLNSLEAGAGLNITAATHVILLHAMTHEEEKQILGRAYRLGRTEPLEVIRLLHPDELRNIHTQ